MSKRKHKHLLIFSYDYPPSNGGIARLCQEIADGMSPYYSDITVLTIKKTGISKPYNYDKVKIVELPSKRILSEIAAWWFLLRLKNKKQTDVLCGLWHPEAALCILAGIKNVYSLAHGTELLSGSSMFRAKFWLPVYAKFVLRKVKKVIANSRYTQGLIQTIQPKSNNVALPLAVNHDFFKPINQKVQTDILDICTVSRVLQFKGHDFIAKTIANLPREEKERIHWNVAGTGPYLNDLKELANELNIQDNVSFHGFVPDKELPIFYNSNDAFVLCTREQQDSTQVEGFGLVFLEAQACGIPVIGARTGGIPDAVVPGNGGWLIEQDNEMELGDILTKLVNNRQCVKEMGELARSRVEQECTWQKYCKELDLLLQ